MTIVGLVGFAGVVVFGLLYIVFFFKGASLKLPVIGMAVFVLVLAASVVLPRLEIPLPGFLGGGDPSQTAEVGDPDDGKLETPGADGFPQTLMDKRGIVIKATGLVENGPQGSALNVSIENRSETDVTVEVRDACVNGWMMDPSFSVPVAAGQETKGAILFLASQLKRSGIDTIADMEFSFHILDQNRVAFLDSDTVTVRTPAADTYQYPVDDSGEELYNENGVRIVSKGFDRDGSVFGPELVLMIENTTDQAITVQARDFLVNGSGADVISSEDILPGKRSAAAITIVETSLEYSGVGTIKNVSFYLRVTDRDQRTTLFDTDVFKIIV